MSPAVLFGGVRWTALIWAQASGGTVWLPGFVVVVVVVGTAAGRSVVGGDGWGGAWVGGVWPGTVARGLAVVDNLSARRGWVTAATDRHDMSR